MEEIIQETILTLANRLEDIRQYYLYKLDTPENIDNLRGQCMCAIDNANQILGGYHIEAVFVFEHTPGDIHASVYFKDTITGHILWS